MSACATCRWPIQGIDFHKSGYTPYASSLFLASDAQLLNPVRRDKVAMPYLFQLVSTTLAFTPWSARVRAGQCWQRCLT